MEGKRKEIGKKFVIKLTRNHVIKRLGAVGRESIALTRQRLIEGSEGGMKEGKSKAEVV